jgi:flagellar FliJ protein
MPFSFNLETLLKYRRVQEETTARELQRLGEELAESRRHLEQLRRSLEEYNRQWLVLEQRGASSLEFSLYRQYVTTLHRNLAVQQQIVAELEDKHEEKRLELIERMKQRRLLEKLKEKRRAEYQLAEYRRERKILDELAVTSITPRL